MATTSHVPPSVAPAVATTAGPGRIRLVAGALAACGTTLAALVATHPWGERVDSSADDVFSYDVLLSNRDAAWPGLLADGFAFAILAVCAALATCHLVRGRGRIAALVGSVLTIVGGVLFAMGTFGVSTLTWFATSDGLSEDAGRDLIAFANDQTGQLLGVLMAGFLLFTLGSLTLTVALARGKAVPMVAVLGFVALTVALFMPLPGAGIDAAQAAQMLLAAGLAIPLWRRAAG